LSIVHRVLKVGGREGSERGERRGRGSVDYCHQMSIVHRDLKVGGEGGGGRGVRGEGGGV